MEQSAEKLSLPAGEQLNGGGFLYQRSVSETYQLHTHDFFEIFLVSRGKAVHCINDTTQLLTEGSFVLIRPQDVHKYDFFNQYDFELINIGIIPALFYSACQSALLDPALFLNPLLPPHVLLTGYHLTDIRRKLLHFDLKEAGLPRKRYLSSLLPFLLYRLTEEPAPASSSSSIPSWLIRLIQQMEEPEQFIAGLPQLLKLANMSQEHLSREFRKHLNMTPTEFINAKRMNLAVALLLENRHEVIEICHECGFNNLSHFYRMFQKQFDCSPKKFLERYYDS